MARAKKTPVVAAQLPTGDVERRIGFQYEKGSLFRTIQPNGVVGGLTPNGSILMTFFTERFPLPQAAVYPVLAGGKVGAEIEEERVVRDGILREMEVGIVMDEHTARLVHEWLTKRLEEVHLLTKPPETNRP